MALVSSATTIRDRLNAASEWNPDGANGGGTLIEVDAKTVNLGDKPFVLRAGQSIIGKHKTLTRLVYTGKPGTAAIVLGTQLDHGKPQGGEIRNLSISCPNGAYAIATAPGVTIEDYLFDNLYLNGGGVYLPGENYMARFNLCRFRNQPGTSLFIEGEVHSLHACNFYGGTVGTGPLDRAVVEVHGSIALSGFTRIEENSGAVLLKARGFKGEGAVFNDGSWLEQHAPAKNSIDIDGARWVGEVVANTSAHPWKIGPSARINPAPMMPPVA